MSDLSDLEYQVNGLTKENEDLKKRLSTMQQSMLKYIHENRELKNKLGIRATGPYNKGVIK